MIYRLVAGDVLQFIRGRKANLLASVVLAILGVHFTLLGALEGAHEFLAFTYAYFPTLFVALAAVAIANERHTRFIDLVLTAPVTTSAYYWGKVLVSVALGSVYLILTLPFGFLFAWLAGWGWLPMIGAHVILGLVVVISSATLGTLVSVLFTHRGHVAAIFMAFGLGLLFTQWPIIARVIMNAAPDHLTSPLLNVLVVSPAFVVMAVSPVASQSAPILHGFVAPDPVLLVLASLALSTVYALMGWIAFTRLQNADTWDARRPLVAALVLVLVASPPVVAGALPDARVDDSASACICAPGFDPVTGVRADMDLRLKDGGDDARLRETYTNALWLYLFLQDPETDAVHAYRNATLTLTTSDFALNRTTIHLGTILVRGNDAPQPEHEPHAVESSDVLLPVSVKPVRMQAAYMRSYGIIQWTLETDEHTWTGSQSVSTEPSMKYPYLVPIGATVCLVAIARAPVLIGGRWRQ